MQATEHLEHEQNYLWKLALEIHVFLNYYSQEENSTNLSSLYSIFSHLPIFIWHVHQNIEVIYAEIKLKDYF